jgi:hypothetical protein
MQAAALAGHAGQESGYDPTNVNPKEDAHGILQWRGDRWQGLQDFAKAQGKDPTDANVQLDYIGKEMHGPEAKAGAGFLAAPDVASASAALKPFIRFGDDSAGKRLGNSMDLYSQYSGAPVGALAQDPTSPVDPTQTTAGAAAAPISLAPTAVGALAPPTTAQSLAKLGATLNPATPAGQPAPQGPQFLAPQQIAMGQVNPQSQQIAQMIAKQYGIGA